MDIYHHPIELPADPERVVIRPFNLEWRATEANLSRAAQLVKRVCSLSALESAKLLDSVYQDFGDRHWHPRKIFLSRFDEISQPAGLRNVSLDEKTKELLGSYFCHEYSYASAALMNPSVTLHPNQSDLDHGFKRVVISMRAVGEGHISTIAFRTGVLGPNRHFELNPEQRVSTAALVVQNNDNPDMVSVERQPESTLDATVIFPVTEFQRNGLEDLRITRIMGDNGDFEWIGTYTAYSGHSIRSELLTTSDFIRFGLIPLSGSASQNKGMALFPKKFDSQYAMIGRQDGQNLFLLRSSCLHQWDRGVQIVEPKFSWEFVQIGNCGPPIELDEGWLLLTHGVGPMRKYAIGAVLLDKDDPSVVLGRTTEPILAASDEQRDGYVPNVVYSCGAMKCGSDLFLPYGIADSTVAFAFIPLESILGNME